MPLAGAAASGTCKDGAIGAALGEIVAQLMPPKNGIAYSDSEKHNVLALSKLVADVFESHDWKGMDQLKSSTKYSVGSLKIDWMLRNRNGSVRGTY